MQFGIMSVSDITSDSTTGHTSDDSERIAGILTIAQHAEEVGWTSSPSASTATRPSSPLHQ